MLTAYHIAYYDPRGAWREWGEYKTLPDAMKEVPQQHEWFIEKRVSTVVMRSKNASRVEGL